MRFGFGTCLVMSVFFIILLVSMCGIWSCDCVCRVGLNKYQDADCTHLHNDKILLL